MLRIGGQSFKAEGKRKGVIRSFLSDATRRVDVFKVRAVVSVGDKSDSRPRRRRLSTDICFGGKLSC